MADPYDDTRDRVIKLEAEVEHMDEKLTDLQSKVNEMHDILLKAKGARWVIVTMAFVGGGASSFAFKLLPFLSPK